MNRTIGSAGIVPGIHGPGSGLLMIFRALILVVVGESTLCMDLKVSDERVLSLEIKC